MLETFRKSSLKRVLTLSALLALVGCQTTTDTSVSKDRIHLITCGDGVTPGTLHPQTWSENDTEATKTQIKINNETYKRVCLNGGK